MGAPRPPRAVGVAVGTMFALAASVASLPVGAGQSAGASGPVNAPVAFGAVTGAEVVTGSGDRIRSILLDGPAFALAVEEAIRYHANGSALLHPDEFAEAVAAVVD